MRFMQRILIVASFALVMSGLCGMQDMQAPSQSSVIPSESHNHLRVVLDSLWPVLDSGNRVGRIYFSALCQLHEDFATSFPRLDIQPPSRGEHGVAAVRDMFRHDKDVSVKETGPDVIRIRIGNVPDEILRVRISRLVFTAQEQYNYWLAIFKIEHAQEVRSAIQKLGVSAPARPFNILIRQPAAGLPHLPPVIRDLTVDQTLDLIARTFGGIVIYEFCASRDEFEIGFVSAGGIHSTPY